VAVREAELQGEVERMNALTTTEKLKADLLSKASVEYETKVSPCKYNSFFHLLIIIIIIQIVLLATRLIVLNMLCGLWNSQIFCLRIYATFKSRGTSIIC